MVTADTGRLICRHWKYKPGSPPGGILGAALLLAAAPLSRWLHVVVQRPAGDGWEPAGATGRALDQLLFVH